VTATLNQTPVDELTPGDVISYSAGSTQTGPEGYRKLCGRVSLMAEAQRHWPELIEGLGPRPALFVNAYPAALGGVAGGVVVDTYLSPRVLSRALQLGQSANHPVVLAGQPLFLADALLRHVTARRPLPDVLMLWVGGYAMPLALQRMLETHLASRVARFSILHFYGVAEADNRCLMARDRNEVGELIYRPRRDVCPDLEGDALLLRLRRTDGAPASEGIRTGDSGRRSGDGWVIWNHERLHPLVREALESWRHEDWRRRTGYIRREGDEILIQLREGERPRDAAELEHFEFAGLFGFSWLDKPCWR